MYITRDLTMDHTRLSVSDGGLASSTNSGKLSIRDYDAPHQRPKWNRLSIRENWY